jgi:hypothetical protein
MSEEAEFIGHMKKELETNFPEYHVTSGECLVYRFLMDAQGQVQPKTPLEPKRGQLAFQTDLMIKKTNPEIPLVVVEVKFGRFTTHDVLTYSAKATKHKEIYPYLRYGLVVGGVKKIQHRFFTHNSGFDFAVAIEKRENLPEIIKVIKQQLRAAELLLSVLQGKEVKGYTSPVELLT